ncbi:peptide chain release factor 2 [Sutcliffiella cohnii]|uniref:Peptide chain release factor 2 n=1 Tax=Sutcliffiella cohnii TaxID=33932 RepID=A0A223KVC8_9BACI|nr:peptide chain release factor 2 [Sutcliffiella cohnii]
MVTIIVEVNRMELAEIRNELEKMAKRLADFRGSL